ncbi:MAG: phenylalanine--tRNA ligase subunit alpha [Sandaracinaceae bacterium]|nr:phenylalanine--tRNA ligase subunit alpha [Sandaracinaceae bacterium]
MSDDAVKEFEEGLAKVEASFRSQLDACGDEQSLRAVNARIAGPTGELTGLLKLMPKLPGDQRKVLGQKANALKSAVSAAFDTQLLAIAKAVRDAELSGPHLDVTLPGRNERTGSLHPITRVAYEIMDVFTSLGFDIVDGPEIDLHENNFDKLGFPPDHPATDMQDSFFINAEAGQKQRSLLRTHTSTMQVREMQKRKPPLAIVAPGQVYRRDDDVTHSPMFFQLEGLLVDEGVSFAHLKGVLTRFAQRMFGDNVPVRFRPSYFPFVEPGGEVDIGCMICRGYEGTKEALARQAECRVCKASGYLEVLGCGMVHPVVFENVGYDSDKYTGFAFGLGIDRIAMLRYGISDIRWLYENDVRFLSQI